MINTILWIFALMLAMVAILWLAAVSWILYTLMFDKDMGITIEQEVAHEL